jgi:hypothetical protein
MIYAREISFDGIVTTLIKQGGRGDPDDTVLTATEPELEPTSG